MNANETSRKAVMNIAATIGDRMRSIECVVGDEKARRKALELLGDAVGVLREYAGSIPE
jgi:hypothetical protein